VGRLINLFDDLQNRRKVRYQASQCRKSGATDGMIGHVLEIVCGMARDIGDDDATEQYIRIGAASRLELRLPGLDPATILLLVQLVWLVYQALKAIGYFDGEGLKSVTPEAINEHFGGL
jgi:hypothetical protein